MPENPQPYQYIKFNIDSHLKLLAQYYHSKPNT